MPIDMTIDHPNRLVLGVARGVLTLTDMAGFTRDVVAAGLMHYRKLVDVIGAEAGFTEREVAALVQVLRELPVSSKRGPLAMVADPERGDIARMFVDLQVDGRLARVFRSVHDAKRWLAEQRVE